jgi:glucose-6-phosphate isomerase
MLFDYSKTHLDAEAMDLLLALAEAADVPASARRCFPARRSTRRRGARSCTPRFAHRAVRSLVDGSTSCPACWRRGRMEAFAMDVRSGAIAGAGGPYTDVVNIGIGGSDLGPAMATLALAPYHDGPRCTTSRTWMARISMTR